MSLPDLFQRFLFHDHEVRGVRVYLNQSLKELLEKHDYPFEVKRLLGETAVATVLLSSSLKFDGKLSIQARGSEPVSLLMAECSNKREVRATAEFNQQRRADLEQKDMILSDLIGQAQLSIMISPEQGQHYQGIVPMEHDQLSQCLEDYFMRSEQLATVIIISCNTEHASGLLLQKLPHQSSEEEEDTWNRLSHFAKTVKPEEMHELESADLINRLFNEENIQLFDPEPVHFNCSCSEERSAQAIVALGQEEALSLVEEQEHIDIDCHFCGQHYQFNKQDVETLFGKKALH